MKALVVSYHDAGWMVSGADETAQGPYRTQELAVSIAAHKAKWLRRGAVNVQIIVHDQTGRQVAAWP
jgi:hypothetical protein